MNDKAFIPFGYLEKGDSFKNMHVLYCLGLRDFLDALKACNVKHAALFQVILNDLMMPHDYIFLKYL